MRKQKKLKGFTLVELIIVIAIAAILIAVAIPQYNKAKLSAEVSAHNSNVQTIKSAAIMASMEEDIQDDKKLKERTAQYLDGKDFPKIPESIFKKEFKDQNRSKKAIDDWIIKNDNGDIVVTPGIYKIVNGEVYKENENPVLDSGNNPDKTPEAGN